MAALVKPVQGDNVVEQFPELFKGPGKLKDSYKIMLREGATPFGLTTPTTSADSPLTEGERGTPKDGEHGRDHED